LSEIKRKLLQFLVHLIQVEVYTYKVRVKQLNSFTFNDR